MSLIVFLTISSYCMFAEVVISPPRTTTPSDPSSDLTKVSHATLAFLSWLKAASNIASETWSHSLSG